MDIDAGQDIVQIAARAVEAARAYVQSVRGQASAAVMQDGRIDPTRLEERQRLVHGYAWAATTVEAIAQLAVQGHSVLITGFQSE